MTPFHKETLPNLIIIGAQKCGTTSLHYYLNQHPQIVMSRVKELNFFIQERYWEKGLEWYMSYFTGKANIHGESSPNYTAYPIFKGVPERMYSVVPGAKLIYILRDPIERMLSEYIHACADGREHQNIENALAHLDNNGYCYRSQYYMQLEQYLPYFQPSNILILTLEDLARHRFMTMQRVFRFLEVDDSFTNSIFRILMHQTKYKRRKTPFGSRLQHMPFIQRIFQRLPYLLRGPLTHVLFFPFSRKITPPVLNTELRQKIVDFLRDDIQRLREYTGIRFEQWNI